MLVSLHVKNLALIEEEEMEFSDGLNILTGETGAGKSIVLGSIGYALGARAEKGIIRSGEEYALIELLLQEDNKKQDDLLQKMGIEVQEDRTILIKRKIYPSRSQCQVNGESVTLRELKELGDSLVDVYGQRENQKLLRKEEQLFVVDEYAGEEAKPLLDQVEEHYENYLFLSRRLEEDSLNGNDRARKIDLLAYEINEIEQAQLKDNEEEELEEEYRKLSSYEKICEAVQEVGLLLEGGENSASEQVGRAGRILSNVQGIDEELDALLEQVFDVDSLLQDFVRSLSDYRDSLSFDPEEYRRIQERLDLIHHLEDKYGSTVEEIRLSLSRKKEELSNLQHFDELHAKRLRDRDEEKQKLEESCRALSKVRQNAAADLTQKIRQELLDLNFRSVAFQIEIQSDASFLSSRGWDSASWLISMNPGEPMQRLEQVASGGELSRIMLALKTVFAGKDDIYTLIFDEIDSGISGQTAWKVAEKMGRLAENHQIFCITHLPQIAAMEDHHFLIEKRVEEERTRTSILRLTEEESTRELARMMGGDKITETALENAAEMKRMAQAQKKTTKTDELKDNE